MLQTKGRVKYGTGIFSLKKYGGEQAEVAQLRI